MTKPFVVICDGFDKDLFAQLQEESTLEVHSAPKISQEELAGLLPKAEALVIRSATTVNKDLVDKTPNLKYVIRAGEGTDNIDKAYCQEKGIKVSNTPGANANSAAEHAIALMFTVLRKTAWAHGSMKSGEWDKAAYAGNELWKKTVGVVGFGKIGQIAATRISGFEPRVLFYDPFIEKSDLPYAEKADLEKVFAESDIITLHTPLMDATKNMVDKKLLDLMKPGAILINASRGGIVNEDDLYATLSEGKIRGAGFDVFATEPLESDNKLRGLDNLVLTPHLGASTGEAQVRVGEMAVHQLKEFFNNNNLLNEVRV